MSQGLETVEKVQRAKCLLKVFALSVFYDLRGHLTQIKQLQQVLRHVCWTNFS